MSNTVILNTTSLLRNSLSMFKRIFCGHIWKHTDSELLLVKDAEKLHLPGKDNSGKIVVHQYAQHYTCVSCGAHRIEPQNMINSIEVGKS